MSRAAINANVTTRSGRNIGGDLRNRIKARMPLAEFSDRFGMTPGAVGKRLDDPDLFTLGQLRELRTVLGMPKDDLVEILRCAL